MTRWSLPDQTRANRHRSNLGPCSNSKKVGDDIRKIQVSGLVNLETSDCRHQDMTDPAEKTMFDRPELCDIHRVGSPVLGELLELNVLPAKPNMVIVIDADQRTILSASPEKAMGFGDGESRVVLACGMHEVCEILPGEKW